MTKRQPLFFMKRALSLAARGTGHVSPNPLVGCVIVKNGRIVGEGFHAFYGGPHAEIVALRRAGKRARGAEMVLTLEPCSHFGKTPPCAPALIQAGIKTVTVAMRDPNPLVKGKGLALLRRARIRVHEGLLKAEAEQLNYAFIKWMKTGLPFVRLKGAISLDGKTATAAGPSRWITSEASRKAGYRLRAQSDAIVIGVQTAIQDNPLLTAHGEGRNPIRVVLDPTLRMPGHLRMIRDKSALTVVVTSPRSNSAKIKSLRKKGLMVLLQPTQNGRFNIRKFLKLMSKLNVSQLLVEGGGETAWTFLQSRLVDDVYFFVAPKLIGGRTAPTAVGGDGFRTLPAALSIRDMTVARLGPDLMIRGKV